MCKLSKILGTNATNGTIYVTKCEKNKSQFRVKPALTSLINRIDKKGHVNTAFKRCDIFYDPGFEGSQIGTYRWGWGRMDVNVDMEVVYIE